MFIRNSLPTSSLVLCLGKNDVAPKEKLRTKSVRKGEKQFSTLVEPEWNDSRTDDKFSHCLSMVKK
jgi:hypothetical protein